MAWAPALLRLFAAGGLILRGLQNTHTGLRAKTARYSAFPSMKTAKNVDEKFKTRLPSTITAQNVDENCQNHEREHETEVDRP